MQSFSVEDIHRLVSRVEGQRRTQLRVPAGPIIAEAAYHDEQSAIPSDSPSHQTSQQEWSACAPSLASESCGHTRLSAYDGLSSVASESTALTVPTVNSDDEIPTVHPIRCEFWQYSDCPHTFHSIPDFIDHCLDHHQRPLPETSICWHCDDWLFRAPEDTPESRLEYYFSRLWHIGGHYRGEQAPDHIRPDHFVLNHLHENGTISTSRFSQLNINESRDLERLWNDLMGSSQLGGRCEVQIAGARGRVRREARRHQRN